MKIFYTALLVSIVTISLSSCSKSKVTPTNPSRSDTSTSLINNTALVGNWNIVTDTIAYNGTNTMYHGVATDHYIFTKYGNLYINEAQYNYVDTAIYNINSLSYSVGWVNSYISVNGVSSRIASSSAPYTITSLDTASLVLTSSIQSANGPRYEQIVFKKTK